MADADQINPHQIAAKDLVQWPAVVWTAISLAVGVVAGSALPTSPGVFLTVLFVWLATSVAILRYSPALFPATVFVVVAMFGACRWQISQRAYEQNTLQDFARQNPTARLTAKIVSIPTVNLRPSSRFAPRLYGASQRTQFVVDVLDVETHSGTKSVRGRCQVYVEGDATSIVVAGDEVELVGKLNWPSPPGNPGEFDYAAFLKRKRIAATAFVNHPTAIKIVTPASPFSLGRTATGLRRAARNAIVSSVDSKTQAVALALLLGNRHQLPSATEEAFVASGTMHLLAISGLHVGILCLFLLKVFNVLLMKRSTALILTALVCALYAVTTDLRPSVLRATVFFWIYVSGQLAGRNQRPATLISLTVVILVTASPEIIFDTGAWLSFLSVAALGWVSSREKQTEFQNEAPPESLTIIDTMKDCWAAIRNSLLTRYKQMLCILAVTTPLVAATFHVISPVGLIINVLLIPFTALTLCVGFSTLMIGLISSPLASGPGWLFSKLLDALQWIVEFAANINTGHLYIPDFPTWFVSAYYVLLFLILATDLKPAKRVLTTTLLICVAWEFATGSMPRNPEGLKCSVLSVGHGSAAVIEAADGRVMLIDAGAMNRGSRAAEIVCNFLWHHGYRKIDSILISHADMDHYNAVPDIMRRMPVGEVVTSVEFVQSRSTVVQSVLDYANECNVPIRVLRSQDKASIGEASITVLQSELKQDLSATELEDNERSLVVLIEMGGHRVLLPGDLEGASAAKLLEQIGRVDFLVSPHHGSIAANPDSLATVATPQTVVVSARDASALAQLESVYATSQAVYFTSNSGCVSISLNNGNTPDVTSFRQNPEFQ